MKRQIMASEQTAVRVASVGLDLVIPYESDATRVAGELAKIANASSGGKYRIAAYDVHEDLTDLYESDYPADLFI